MSTKLKHQQQDDQAAGGGGNVVPLSKCACEGCNKRSELTNFCGEHYGWFKFGLITKEGKKASDFDKKWMAFAKRKAA